VNEQPHAGDDQHHQQGKLVKVEIDLDRKGARVKPGEESLNDGDVLSREGGKTRGDTQGNGKGKSHGTHADCVHGRLPHIPP
jgi:hypothetical protein